MAHSGGRVYHIIDTFIAKKKLKDNLSTVLQEA
jgi:hypothetical protein